MTIDHILTLLLVVPAVGLIPLFVFRSDPRAAKQVAIVTTFVELVLSLVMLSQFKVGEADFQLVERAEWLPTLGIRYLVGVDGISVLLVPMTTLLTLISVLYSSGGAIKERVTAFMASFLLLEIGMIGVFVSLDLVLFYVFWEVMLVPMYFLIGIWGGERKLYAAIKFFLYTLFGSVMMLIGILVGIFYLESEDVVNNGLRFLILAATAKALDGFIAVGPFLTAIFTAIVAFLAPAILTSLVVWFVKKHFFGAK